MTWFTYAVLGEKWTNACQQLEISADLAVIARFEDEAASAIETTVDERLQGALIRQWNDSLQRQTSPSGFLDTLGQLPFGTIIWSGKKDKVGPAGLRDAGAIAVKEALSRHYTSAAIDGSLLTASEADQFVLGCRLGSYTFDEFQAAPEDGPKPTISNIEVTGSDVTDASLARIEAIADGVCLSRKLINEPANVCTPERLAALAVEISKAPGFTVDIWDRQQIIDKGFGGLTAVSQGAAVEPRFIHMSYTPVGGTSEPAIALVGKGITFDAGGLCIKPAKGMADMYIDMGGSAAVMGAMQTVAKTQPGRAVHGIVGACENMTGADAYRPSDILTMYSGKTVEVLNTDAEGRLVLADAIAYAREFNPECIIDLATLTGACMVGLGQTTLVYSRIMRIFQSVCSALHNTPKKVYGACRLTPSLMKP